MIEKPLKLVVPLFVFSLVLASPARSAPAKSLLQALTRYATKEASGEGTERLTREVGEATFSRVSAALAREGSEEVSQRALNLVAKYGPDAIRALDNAPSPGAVLRALHELPAEQVPLAIQRLASGRQGRELAELAGRYGPSALRAEVSHPGVGVRFVRALGTDGASLCGRLSKDQAIALGRHVDDIAVLPPSQRQSLMGIIRADADRFLAFVGRFVEANPGKTLFTTATTGLVLVNAERLLGGDEIVIGADGQPTVVSKSGLIGRGVGAAAEAVEEPLVSGISGLIRGAVTILLTAFGIFAAIKLVGVWRHEQRRERRAEVE